MESQNPTKSVQSLKGFSAFSQQTFNKVTPKNIKLRFMKMNDKSLKKSESNQKPEITNFGSKKTSLDLQPA